MIDNIAYLETNDNEVNSEDNGQLSFNELKADPVRAGVDSVLKEVNKLRTICNLELPNVLFRDIPHKALKQYRQGFPQMICASCVVIPSQFDTRTERVQPLQ
ncbi:hypothetical protein [Paenibacillus sp. OSY-SE]|uniref:hypothetical protein n=1 Tax=Paenibacillus sp. OSY-SE TaxID=1196323 RepID=UPI0002D94797|nr:hypothetical protein [Paenibacillus sp. OSY-SE]